MSAPATHNVRRRQSARGGQRGAAAGAGCLPGTRRRERGAAFRRPLHFSFAPFCAKVRPSRGRRRARNGAAAGRLLGGGHRAECVRRQPLEGKHLQGPAAERAEGAPLRRAASRAARASSSACGAGTDARAASRRGASQEAAHALHNTAEVSGAFPALQDALVQPRLLRHKDKVRARPPRVRQARRAAPSAPGAQTPSTAQEIRLLVGCALGDMLRICAPEVPYESDETLKARAPRERPARRAGAGCRASPDSSLRCPSAARGRAGRVPPAHQLVAHAGGATQQPAVRPRGAAAERGDQGAARRGGARLHFARACPLRGSRARRTRPPRRPRAQVKCFVPMLDLRNGAPELVAELLRACLDAVTCVAPHRCGALQCCAHTHPPRHASPANVAAVEMDMAKARGPLRRLLPKALLTSTLPRRCWPT